MNELLCRPDNVSVAEYFNVSDTIELWHREEIIFKKATEYQSEIPINVNITISSLPFFMNMNYSWNGGLELVEWAQNSEYVQDIKEYIHQLKRRGFMVWIDDLVEDEWWRWKDIDVTGFKVKYQDIQNNKPFLNELKKCNKPIIVEQIEKLSEKETVQRFGIPLAQGFLFDSIYQ
ncbi:EAL domain-containing protein [Chengkuizengella sediminis]|uniref:EAL domain-containing protein n=1 Tax=Chengkuizengella sediminis TaxID=1885917 RepID=UPI00138A1960|nr:EAL domain-containing protein [Chengkuizengella sediminis]NDI36649.1 EAL domain-containing protein [Chengkuizengella sediminis]